MSDRRKERNFIPGTVTLYHEGIFYRAFGQDALVLAEVCDYQTNEMRDSSYMTGGTSIDAIVSALEAAHVSYILIAGQAEEKREHDFGEENSYSRFGRDISKLKVRSYAGPLEKEKRPAVLSISGNSASSKTGSDGPHIYRLTALMPLIMDHGEPSTLYDWGTDIEFLFPDGYIYRLSK